MADLNESESRARSRLRSKLREVLGSSAVYYDPPESVKMDYPAIVYKHSDTRYKSADGKPYIIWHIYRCTVIAKDDDVADAIGYKLARTVDGIKYDRSDESDGLHHRIYNVTQY